MPDTTNPTLRILTSAPVYISSTSNGFNAGLVDNSTPYLSAIITPAFTLQAYVLCYITVPENNLNPTYFSATIDCIDYSHGRLHGICIESKYISDINSSLWYLEFDINQCEDYNQFVEFTISDPSGNPGRGSISIPKSGIGDPE